MTGGTDSLAALKLFVSFSDIYYFVYTQDIFIS